MWKVNEHKKKQIKKPILIEGLPGIANVGKVVVDYLIDQTKAVKIMSFFSYKMPNSVFVNEENLVELPRIEVYHKKIKNQDFLFLSGDVQPQTEEASYTFSQKVIDIVNKMHCKEIITLGGIGLQEIPEKPTVYCTGNMKKIVKKLSDAGAKNNIYGLVGPIIGVSGLLIGLSKEKDIPAGALLAETYGHPMYLGLKGAKQTLKIIKKAYEIDIDYKDINKEIKLMEKEMRGEDVDDKDSPLSKLKKVKETNYIG